MASITAVVPQLEHLIHTSERQGVSGVQAWRAIASGTANEKWKVLPWS